MTSLSSSSIEIFVDGACSGNPGPGGWGALIRFSEGEERELSGSEPSTTNNRMELMAALKALESLGTFQGKIAVYTDSLYLRDGMTQWILKWKNNNWYDARKRGIKNLDLWEQLNRLNTQNKIEWHWVRGHAGHRENEHVDLLARNAIVQQMMQDTGS